MGLYSDDVARLGQLSEDSARAARLVVDTELLRTFHDVVLGSGALPLDVLARQVRQWVDQQSA